MTRKLILGLRMRIVFTMTMKLIKKMSGSDFTKLVARLLPLKREWARE